MTIHVPTPQSFKHQLSDLVPEETEFLKCCVTAMDHHFRNRDNLFGIPLVLNFPAAKVSSSQIWRAKLELERSGWSVTVYDGCIEVNPEPY